VFNFFSPTYMPAGELTDRALFAPELELATEFQVTMIANVFHDQVLVKNSLSDSIKADDVVIDIEEEVSMVQNPAALLDRVTEKLLGGRIPPALYETILTSLEAIPEEKAQAQAAEAIYLVAVSPEFAAQY